MTDQDPNSGSHERRNVLKALGIGGLAATGVGAAAGNVGAAPGNSGSGGQDGSESLTTDLSDVELTDESGTVVDTFTDGTLSIDDLRIDRQTGDLLASGTIEGTLDSSGEAVSESFDQTTAQLDSDDACTILTLDLGPLDLEILGLRVQLNEINLDITGQTGSGNLLGNLLCAIADLGSGGLSDLANPIVSALNNLLNQLLG